MAVVVRSRKRVSGNLLEYFKIGHIYMSVNNVNPSALFGGIWERWGQGRTPLGVFEPSDVLFNGTTTNNANDYRISAPITAYAVGQRYIIRFHAANTSETVNVRVQGQSTLLANRRMSITSGATTNPQINQLKPGEAWLVQDDGSRLVLLRRVFEENTFGGAETHVLSQNENPSHNHGREVRRFRFISMDSTSTTQLVTADGNLQTNVSPTASGNDDHFNIMSTGSGQPHNNMQPYITCYMWLRVA